MGVKSLKYSNPAFQVEVDWMITQRCNYSCSYCGSYDNNQPFSFKTLEEYIKAFEYLSDRYGNKTIRLNFLGGEPTLFKQWVELINWLSNHNYAPEITTNLSVPVKSYINKLNGYAKEFITASYHAEFSTLEEFHSNAKALSEMGYLKAITLLADPKNWDYSMQCYDRLKEVGKVNLIRIKTEFNDSAAISSSFLEYTEEQLKVFDKQSHTDEYITLEVDDQILHPSIGKIRKDYSNFKGMNCAVGRDRLHILPNGDSYPSACLLNVPRAKMGNIYKQDIKVPKRAIVCPWKECLCGPDIRIEKWAQE